MRAVFGKLYPFVILLLALFEFVASATWYTADDNTRYLIETEYKYNWLQASNECARQGLQLAVLENAAKNQHFDALLRRVLGKSHDLWIGYTDEFNPSNAVSRPFYAAATGEKMIFNNFGTGEPNNSGGGEDCVHIFSSIDFKWNDKKCSVTYGFICEEHYLTTKYRADLAVKRQATNQKNTKVSAKFSTTQTEIKEVFLNSRNEADNILVELKQSSDEIIEDLKKSLQELAKKKPYLQAVIADVGQAVNDAVAEKEEEYDILLCESRQLMDNIHQSAEVSISEVTSIFSEELVNNTKEIDNLLVY